MGPARATLSVTSLLGRGKDRVHSCWLIILRIQDQRYVQCWNNSEGPCVSKCLSDSRGPGGGSGIQGPARSVQVMKDQEQLCGRWTDYLCPL